MTFLRRLTLGTALLFIGILAIPAGVFVGLIALVWTLTDRILDWIAVREGEG